MNKKGICKNCGDDISDDSNSNEFCSGEIWSRINSFIQKSGVEYQMEHNKKKSVNEKLSCLKIH